MSRTIIPFGPQHPVLPEPIHPQLVMDNETVVEALPATSTADLKRSPRSATTTR